MASQPRRFVPSFLEGVENVEDYQPGGFHPISIGDSFMQGRYRILHKLGYGGSSTVWLARDEGRLGLVTLKALRADASIKPASAIPDLTIPEMLREASPPCINSIRAAVDHFFVEGPNGSHLFLVFPFAGPSVLAMSDCPGRNEGSRRLRADLARKVALQVAVTVDCMHRAGIVHGDLTASNILFLLSPHVLNWSDTELYDAFGTPRSDEVRTLNGDTCPSFTPEKLVASIDNAKLSDPSFLQESILLADFGQSYTAASPPPDYEPATRINYFSPEARFEGHAGFEADVWALGCAIFEIRAGCALFSSYFGSKDDILKQTVEMLGRLPDPWWAAFEKRELWFEEDGTSKSEQDQYQESEDVAPQAPENSIRGQLRFIGIEDDAPFVEEGPMVEKTGTRLREEEVELLSDLLEKMLKYRPEERITMHEVLQHPWFAFSG